MSELRIQFENTFPVPAHWIEFDEKRNKYVCQYNAIDHHLLIYQAKWEVWQSRQSEIDQLKKQLSDSDYLKVQHRERRCELNKEVEKLKAEKAGLEKRIDGALKITKKMATSINSVALWSLDLDKTLRGEHE